MAHSKRDTQIRYRKWKQAHPESFACDCGRQAVVMVSGEMICARCLAIQDTMWARDGEDRGYARCGVKERVATHTYGMGGAL